MIRLCGVSRHYKLGDACIKALDDVSMWVRRGEFVAVVGRSGSGKSTLMNLLGCLDRPTAGQYLLDGREVGNMRARELSDLRGRGIGFVFQSFNLLPGLSALENAELPLLYLGVPAAERRARAYRAFERVGLSDRMAHKPSEMSGGQQQRTAIARAIIADPPLILADEPTGNLDSGTGREVLALLRALNRRGRTLVLITHDPLVARQADRVLRLEDGKIE